MATNMAYAYETGLGARCPLLPILKPAAWPQIARLLTTPLLRGVARVAVPHVALANVLEPAGTVYYVGQERLDYLGAAAEQLLCTAFHNLRQRTGSWRWLHRAIAVADDDAFASERVLDPAFLLRGAAQLGARTGLVVAVPRRGLLLATPAEVVAADSAHAYAFAGLAAQLYREGGDAQISPLPFQVTAEGRLAAALEPG